MKKRFKIDRKKYNSKIKVYYQDDLNYGLAEDLIKYFWLYQKSHNDDRFHGLNKPQIVKRKKKCETSVLEYNGGTFYIKRYFSVSLDKKLLSLVRRPKALKCLIYSKHLEVAGFNVAEPVFALAYTKGFFEKESIFVMKKYLGINFREYLNSSDSDLNKEKAILSFTSTIGDFYKNGFIHGDPNLENFIINEENGQYNFGFIDVDQIFRRLPSQKAVLQSIGKLYCFAYCFFSDSNPRVVNSEEKIMFYLSSILKSYNPRINIDYARLIAGKAAVKVLLHWNCSGLVRNSNLLKKYI